MLSNLVRERRSTAVLLLAFLLATFSISCQQANISDDFAAEQGQGSLDSPPEGVLRSLSNVDLSTMQLLAERPGQFFWAVNNLDGDVCLVNAFVSEADNWATGMSCTDLAQFERHGVGVGLSSGTQYATAVYMPDGYTQSAKEQLPEAFVTDNLVVFDTRAQAQLATNEGRTILDSEESGEAELELIFP